MRILAFLLLMVGFSSCGYYIMEPRWNDKVPLQPQTYPGIDAQLSFAIDSSNLLIKKYAERPFPEWAITAKVEIPRVLVCKLLQGKEVAAVNQYLLSKNAPWGRSGSDWALHKNGDYDFTEIGLIGLLYIMKDRPDLLYPATQEHLVAKLLTHSGGKPHLRMPGTLKTMQETENHILMGEISRYLRNQYLFEKGDTAMVFDNQKNGLEQWLLQHLRKKQERGFYEFNSMPYSGYSLTAINTLYSFAASPAIRYEAEVLLDKVVEDYTMGSYRFRRYPPFRRRMERVKLKGMDEDPMTSIVTTLLSIQLPDRKDKPALKNEHFAVFATLLKYRLKQEQISKLFEEKQDYMVTIGHGYRSSPELYSAGKGYLISGGGVQRRKTSQLIPRPIVLILDDGIMTVDSCFRLCDKGSIGKWNNTGVWKDFACAASPIYIPPQYQAIYREGNWQVFQPSQHFKVLTYSGDNVSLLFIDKSNMSTTNLVDKMKAANSSLDLKRQVTTPNGVQIKYNVHAPKDKWVIKEVDGKPLKRDVDDWLGLRYF
ncbi:MAG: hypothetical protein SFW35_07940 [Chitinophagales bacterium]|nr:hypothetical protein [Chitinophagales bacterium]